jgi:hypothetical protein
MVRSPAAPSPLLFSELLFADSGADDGARVIGATDDDDDVGFAWSGRWRRRDLRGRSINDGNFSSTDMVRLASLAPGAALNDQRNLAALTILSVVMRAHNREQGDC